MSDKLIPAAELAAKNKRHFPNETAAYRKARNALLTKEIELRRQIEAVAAERRKLPAGGEVTKDYRFTAEDGRVVLLSELFGGKDTLIVYSYMFGPQREKPCPMCTSQMAGWEGKVRDVEQQVALAMTARSPIERLVKAKQARGWKNLKLYSDGDGDFTRDYVSAKDEDMPAYNVFVKRDGKIRHFWAEEMAMDMADPGQDPRGAPDLDPLWTLLDTTPKGRDPKWYPKLEY